MSQADQLVELTADECEALLRRKRLGRLALQTPPGLRIFPVNYAMDGDDVVFRTLPYGAIATSAHDAEVAFEVDDIDEHGHLGWSVLAVGRCTRIEDPAGARTIREGGDPTPWVEGIRMLYFRIRWESLTGRQLGAGPGQSLVDPVIPGSRPAT